MKKLDTGSILSNGIQLGLKNLVPILINYILFILTCWVPYLNIGTLIGISSGIPLKMSKGQTISPTEIFNPEYRKSFGEYFILMGLMMMGYWFGFIFFIVPAYILIFCWFIADLLFLDKKLNPLDALKKSNELMYDNKLAVFLSLLGFFIAFGILAFICEYLGIVGSLIMFIAVLAFVPIAFGIKAYVYSQLDDDDSNDNLVDHLIDDLV